jgi:hypothetical protein
VLLERGIESGDLQLAKGIGDETHFEDAEASGQSVGATVLERHIQAGVAGRREVRPLRIGVEARLNGDA